MLEPRPAQNNSQGRRARSSCSPRCLSPPARGGGYIPSFPPWQRYLVGGQSDAFRGSSGQGGRRCLCSALPWRALQAQPFPSAIILRSLVRERGAGAGSRRRCPRPGPAPHSPPLQPRAAPRREEPGRGQEQEQGGWAVPPVSITPPRPPCTSAPQQVPPRSSTPASTATSWCHQAAPLVRPARCIPSPLPRPAPRAAHLAPPRELPWPRGPPAAPRGSRCGAGHPPHTWAALGQGTLPNTPGQLW